jgi:SAM-dependent methyltransferase
MLLKTSFIERIVQRSGLENPRILELACGTARHIDPILKAHPEYTYVGVEPYPASFEKAKLAIGDLPNVTLVNQLAYGSVGGVSPESFDIVFSLSALEHIKNLEAFIALSAESAKKGALVVHRYDLGHALYPGTLKERLQVWVGNTLPKLLPENRFVRYVPQDEVEGLLTRAGCTVERVTYHNMPNHRGFEKYAENDEALKDAAKELGAWEYEHENLFARIPLSAREYLFPAVAIWARKL